VYSDTTRPRRVSGAELCSTMLVPTLLLEMPKPSTAIVLQSSAPETLRGRVVSLYTSVRFGFDAIGGLLAGLLAAQLGAPPVLAAAGVLLLLYCLWDARRASR
jgi:hypothetical protein